MPNNAAKQFIELVEKTVMFIGAMQAQKEFLETYKNRLPYDFDKAEVLLRADILSRQIDNVLPFFKDFVENMLGSQAKDLFVETHAMELEFRGANRDQNKFDIQFEKVQKFVKQTMEGKLYGSKNEQLTIIKKIQEVASKAKSFDIYHKWLVLATAEVAFNKSFVAAPESNEDPLRWNITLFAKKINTQVLFSDNFEADLKKSTLEVEEAELTSEIQNFVVILKNISHYVLTSPNFNEPDFYNNIISIESDKLTLMEAKSILDAMTIAREDSTIISFDKEDLAPLLSPQGEIGKDGTFEEQCMVPGSSARIYLERLAEVLDIPRFQGSAKVSSNDPTLTIETDTLTKDMWETTELLVKVKVKDLNMREKKSDPVDRDRFTVSTPDAKTICITDEQNGYNTDRVSLINHGTSLQTVLPANWFSEPTGLGSARSDLIELVMLQIKAMPKGTELKIGNCFDKPEVAKQLFDIAKAKGLNPKYSDDGTYDAVKSISSLTERMFLKR